MNILLCLFIGLISGGVGRLAMRGYGFGVLIDMLLGVAGSFVGAFVFSVNFAAYGLWGLIPLSVFGAVLFLATFGWISRSSGPIWPLGKL
jgi:uncharacterized membrane protein YeaQ/YmgE (transglycosylase-associated protein family)